MEIKTDNPFEMVLDRLREKGWMKHNFGGFDGPNCIRGAAQRAGIDPWMVTYTVRDLVRREYPDRANTATEVCAHFNDHPDTTFEDVERVLEKAAVKWEEERVMRND